MKGESRLARWKERRQPHRQVERRTEAELRLRDAEYDLRHFGDLVRPSRRQAMLDAIEAARAALAAEEASNG
jgi:hypothetical protein